MWEFALFLYSIWKFCRRIICPSDSSKRPLVGAVEVIPVAHSQQVAVSLVEPDPVLDLARGWLPTLDPSIDDVGDDSISRNPSGSGVGARRGPLPCDDAVAGWLRGLWGHPEPERCLE